MQGLTQDLAVIAKLEQELGGERFASLLVDLLEKSHDKLKDRRVLICGRSAEKHDL